MNLKSFRAVVSLPARLAGQGVQLSGEDMDAIRELMDGIGYCGPHSGPALPPEDVDDYPVDVRFCGSDAASIMHAVLGAALPEGVGSVVTMIGGEDNEPYSPKVVPVAVILPMALFRRLVLKDSSCENPA